MTEFIINHAGRLLWLPCALVLPALYLLGAAKRRQDVLGFLADITPVGTERSKLSLARPAVLCLAAASIIVALAGPAWNPHPRHPLRQGRDLVFVLDVSNSMLASDIPPSRLARAKSAVHDCVRTLDGQRVGLAIFAGVPVIVCPLTLDYDFFGHALDAVGPASVEQGGTRIGDALSLTCDKLLGDATQAHRDIILISDGGDQGESTTEATQVIDEMGIKLIVIGIGSSGTGARVPDPRNPGRFMLHRGEEVWTKLEAESLRRLARSCEQGVYLPVGTSNMELGKIYRDLSRHPSPRQFAEETVTAHSQAFPFFIGVALVSLWALVLMPAGTRLSAAPRTAQVVVLFLLSAGLVQGGGSETRRGLTARGTSTKRQTSTPQPWRHSRRPRRGTTWGMPGTGRDASPRPSRHTEQRRRRTRRSKSSGIAPTTWPTRMSVSRRRALTCAEQSVCST